MCSSASFHLGFFTTWGGPNTGTEKEKEKTTEDKELLGSFFVESPNGKVRSATLWLCQNNYGK
jgi:hypothetical protein